MGTYSPPTQLVSDVADYVKRTFGDESGVQVTDADIFRWVNAAQKEIVSSNSVLKGVGTIPVVAGVPTFDASSLGILNIQTIHVDGRKIKYLSFVDAEEHILKSDPQGAVVAGVEFWYEWAGIINLYPVPSSPGILTIYYTKLPTAISSLTDPLSVPDMYFNRVIEFVMSQAYEMDENFGAADNKLSVFGNSLLSMHNSEDRPPTDFYPTITVLPEDM